METEILTPKSEVEEFQTPHDCNGSPKENDDIDPDDIVESYDVVEPEQNYSIDPEPLTCQESDVIDNKNHEENKEDKNLEKFQEHNAKLEERLKELKEQMVALKGQLQEEKVAWQKELEEAMKVARVVNVTYTNENFTSENYNMDLVPKSDDGESLISEPTLSEFSILDYEQKLATYQDALAKAQLEKRNLLKRQLAASAYKRRLLEVEKLCNMELLKVKQNVQFLQPLQALASSWDNNQTENISKFDDELTGNVTKSPSDSNPPLQSGDENVKSDFVTVEDLENTVFRDLKEFSSQIAATSCGLNLNEADEYAKKTLMTNWYSNELGPHSPFNPLM